MFRPGRSEPVPQRHHTRSVLPISNWNACFAAQNPLRDAALRICGHRSSPTAAPSRSTSSSVSGRRSSASSSRSSSITSRTRSTASSGEPAGPPSGSPVRRSMPGHRRDACSNARWRQLRRQYVRGRPTPRFGVNARPQCAHRPGSSDHSSVPRPFGPAPHPTDHIVTVTFCFACRRGRGPFGSGCRLDPVWDLVAGDRVVRSPGRGRARREPRCWWRLPRRRPRLRPVPVRPSLLDGHRGFTHGAIARNTRGRASVPAHRVEPRRRDSEGLVHGHWLGVRQRRCSPRDGLGSRWLAVDGRGVRLGDRPPVARSRLFGQRRPAPGAPARRRGARVAAPRPERRHDTGDRDHRVGGAARGPLAEVLDRAVSGSASVVGVCFGAQLIAVALAGPRAVRPARRGMEVGLSRVRCSVSGTDHVVSEFHHHEIRPAAIRSAGASLTFGNEHSEVQGFAIGSTIAGFQFHPELDPRRTASTIHANRTVIRSVGACPTAALRSVREHRRAWHPMSFDRLVVSRLGRVGTPDVAPAASTDRRSVAS